ncbi:MAG: radical SAM family heme chaperone HemW [Actinomycetota bacterium]|nr:radical SAM family heme chaperone HemW [Actinomycetota bacterium]
MSSGPDTSDLAGELAGPRLPSHVYLHVPFCRSKCSYCDFYSVSDPARADVDAVLLGLETEVHRWVQSGLPGVLETVYVGGGTPTFAMPHLRDVLGNLVDEIPLRAGAEITVEANPDSLDSSVARALRGVGVTRISVGVQSFDDHSLRVLGRAHDVQQAQEACETVLDAGLDLSIDLMCGVPGQSVSSWVETLDRAVRTGARHISVYPLTLEEGTPLAVACDSGLLDEPDPDMAAEMMVLAEEALALAGIERYEVANYAVPGHESAHNLAYWTGHSYLGVGPAAHGMLDAATARAVGLVAGPQLPVGTSRVRYAYAADFEAWLLQRDPPEIETLSEDEARREDVMLGLRLVRGVPASAIHGARLDSVVESLASQDLLEAVDDQRDERRWRTTRRGWLLGNEVFRRVWTQE